MRQPDPRPRSGQAPAYRTLDRMSVRAPMLPVEFFLALGGPHTPGPPDLRAIVTGNPWVRWALAVGSPDLFDALERPSTRDGARLRAKLLRYLIRISSRPTPYGLFAGVALGRWGDGTDLSIAEAPARTRTRLDMGGLLGWVLELESQPRVYRHLRLVANPAALDRAGRVFLAERALADDRASAAGMSVRATGVVRKALAAAREPIRYADLAGALLAASPSATPEKVDALLGDLLRQTFLLTDLRPPLTAANPARYVLDRLAEVPGIEELHAGLSAVLDDASVCDAQAPTEALAAYRRLSARAAALWGTPAPAAPQVDAALGLGGNRVHEAVGREVARAAEILLRLTPWPQGPPHLAAYRREFEARYGQDREVALIELLDLNFGLGPPGASELAPAPTPPAGRTQALMELASAALCDRQFEVELDEATLARLAACDPARDDLPASLELSVFVSAESAEAVDAGEFLVVLGPNVGALEAGRSLGRFADLLGPDATDLLARAAEAQTEHDPDRLAAELVCMPRPLRVANVVVRPAVRGHEIVLGTSPGVSPSRVIPPGELVVGLRGDRFYVRWPAAGAEVRVSAGHMLNPRHSPALGRLLTALGYDGLPMLSGFDWGPAHALPFLPRVRVGRFVLSQAQWRLDRFVRADALPCETPGVFTAALARWRDRWHVPRFVYLTEGDNRLLLDLETSEQADVLRAHVARLRDGEILRLQEALPGPEGSWVRGPGGRYVTELIVPLVLREPRGPSRPAVTAVTAAPPVPDAIRLRPPGSEWLYVKLYGPRSLEDDLILGPIRQLVQDAIGSGAAEDWFFVRYADPAAHVRLRFRGDPNRLRHVLLPEVCAWAGRLMADGACARFGFDTYDREVERYGGEAAAREVERLFRADSQAALDLIRLARGPAEPLGREALVALSADDLLAALGLDARDRARWGRDRSAARDEAGPAFRAHKAELRALLGGRGHSPERPWHGAFREILAARRAALAPIVARLDELARDGRFSRPLPTVRDSVVHMHANRLLGTNRNAERVAYGLLARARASLMRYPG